MVLYMVKQAQMNDWAKKFNKEPGICNINNKKK